jgi:kynureninase
MDAGLERLRAKSVALTGYLERRLDKTVRDRIEIVTPRDPARRGCQLSMRLRGGADSGRAVFDRLGEMGMVCDWREPDIIRAAPAPLYNTFSEVERLVEALDAATVQP